MTTSSPNAQSPSGFKRTVSDPISRSLEQLLNGKSGLNDACIEQAGELDGLADMKYMERLAHYIDKTSVYSPDSKIDLTALDFRPVYAANIHHLQYCIGKEISRVRETHMTSHNQLQQLQKLIKDYTSALRDFEFIHTTRVNTVFVKEVPTQYIDDGPGSPLQAKLISELGLKLDKPGKDIRPILDERDLLGEFVPEHSFYGKFKRMIQREDEAAVREARSRFVFAMAGGLAIMTPMMIMAVHEVPTKNLITIAIAIFLFSCGVAVFSRAPPENLLGATAAYAAVLMVFV